jgi:hypothetical protein
VAINGNGSSTRWTGRRTSRTDIPAFA